MSIIPTYRPHQRDRTGCYQTGSAVDGVLDWTNNLSSTCPTSDIVNFNKWFNVKVVVKADKDTAEIYLDGQLVTSSQKMNLPKKAAGGVVVANGYEDNVRFKNLNIAPL